MVDLSIAKTLTGSDTYTDSDKITREAHWGGLNM